jgi:hypothetical protein
VEAGGGRSNEKELRWVAKPKDPECDAATAKAMQLDPARDEYSAWQHAGQDAYNKHCYWWQNLDKPGAKPENPECDAAIAKEAQLQQAYVQSGEQALRNWSLPKFFVVTFTERAELAAAFIVPPLLAYILGAALFWVCRPLTKGSD